MADTTTPVDAPVVSSVPPALDAQQKKQQQEMMLDEDPLLISQTLTYVTDDGSVLHSFQSSSFSFGFKLRFIILEIIFVLLLVAAVPIGAHGTVVAVSVANLLVLAWFWYNLVRSVDVTDDGALRFWIGNIEVDVPFDKIVSIRRVASTSPCSSMMAFSYPYRGFLSDPTDGVAIVTTVPSTPFWLWPRSAGKPDRSCCFGIFACPRLTVMFSPTGGSLNFIREVENEMRNFSNGKMQRNRKPKSTTPTANPDFLDV
ncbi:expressed unknown protein [Seminavis robusta]|uniref:Uncharacterized protein n=1 Tax=Seminavis robusta TaxID=568900 RepID=A0A9N8HRF6_9STRA|nr:expressed unknown protein [Seminavis robusta]|eukprot:Sro1391_g268760.1 n/a (257) ;mRNA; f:21087-21936